MKIKRIISIVLSLLLAISAITILSSCSGQINDGVLIYEERSNGFGVMGCADAEATEVVIPAEYDGKPVVAIYGMNFFTKMEKVTIPETITYVGSEAFSDCSALKEVVWGAAEISNCKAAFKGAGSSTGLKLIVKSTVVELPFSLFSGCANLTEIVFEGAPKKIDGNTFYNCTGLTSVQLPEGIEAIGNNTFEGCSSLSSITLPESLTQIGSYAFGGCTALESISFGTNVTSFGSKVFKDCENLISINYNGTVEEWESNISYSTSADTYGENVGKNNPDFAKYGTRVRVNCSDGTIELKN